MADPNDAAHLTRLLHQWRDGSQDALDQLMPHVYDELRTLAARQLKNAGRSAGLAGPRIHAPVPEPST